MIPGPNIDLGTAVAGVFHVLHFVHTVKTVMEIWAIAYTLLKKWKNGTI